MPQLELPAIFSDHAVLQRDKTVPVWGWAESGQEVTVEIGGKTAKGTADASGKWRTDLPKLDAMTLWNGAGLPASQFRTDDW